jgi:mono/diheme cytochrome c family protein
MRRLIWVVVGVVLLAAAAFLILTTPRTIDASELPQHTPDVKNGEYMFYAGGCASCHAAPAPSGKCDDPAMPDKLSLAGGRCLKSPYGTFYAPNISPDREDGIGAWSDIDFVNAMMRGVSPEGTHLYPAFPYMSYQRMSYPDVLDIKTYLETLKAIKSKPPQNDLKLPYRLRRGIGLWKLLFMDDQQFQSDSARGAELNRGAYLVEGPGHCGECHTPRDALGGPIEGKQLAGGPAPEGKGYIPNLTPGSGGLSGWSASDIAYALKTGFTPDFDMLGGTMTKVQENMAKLTDEDRKSIAEFLKSLPPVDSTSGDSNGEGDGQSDS